MRLTAALFIGALRIMKLLGVSGSLRQASFNTALLAASRALAPDGVLIEDFPLHDLPLFNQDLEDQGAPDAVVRWKDAIRDADGVLVACPEYKGGVTGVTGTVRAQDALRLNLRRAGADVGPLGEVLVFQAHTKIADGTLIDERTREALRRHLAAYVAALGARP